VSGPPPEIEALRRCLRERQLRLEVLPADAGPAAPRWRMIRVHRGTEHRELPVGDDFDDCERPNQVLWLHLVLRACRWLRECDDLAEWRTESEAPAEHAADLHTATAAVVDCIEAWTGPDVDPIPDWDFEMNTGLARALRAADDRQH